MVSLFVGVKCDLESGPFVLFDTDRSISLSLVSAGNDGESSRQALLRQGEIYRRRTINVGKDVLGGNLLAIGIPQRKLDLAIRIGHGFQITVVLMIVYGTHLHLLPRTIDGTIGKQI